MTHPLTDDIIEEIAEDVFCYDYSIPTFKRDMRAAADWQLERVIEWIEENGYENGYEYVYYHHVLGSQTEHRRMIDDLRKAMRPQVVDLPQANSDVCGEEGAKRALQRTIEENYEVMRKLSDS